MRFRLWVAGKLVDEAWVDCSNPDAEHHVDNVRDRHQALADRAARADEPWLVEVYDPAKPEGWAYLRFGDDEAGMVDPRPLL